MDVNLRTWYQVSDTSFDPAIQRWSTDLAWCNSSDSRGEASPQLALDSLRDLKHSVFECCARPLCLHHREKSPAKHLRSCQRSLVTLGVFYECRRP
jgi:hypothetical protein